MIKYKKPEFKIVVSLEYTWNIFGIKYRNKSYIIIKLKTSIRSKKKYMTSKLEK